MVRPRKISDDQILAAACTVFLRDGFSASTTEIARLAGVSEGTIFKRFSTKQALFRRAMECDGAAWGQELEERVGKGEMRQQLIQLASELIAHFIVLMPREMQLMTQGGFDPKVYWQDNPDAGPLVALKQLTKYVSAEIHLGRLGRTDAELVARTLLATTHNYAFMETVGLHSKMTITSDSYARSCVDLLWNGLAPHAAGESAVTQAQTLQGAELQPPSSPASQTPQKGSEVSGAPPTGNG